MITDLETLLNQDEFKNLVDAINKNQKYYLSNNGLTVKAESTDDSLFLLISYERQKEESDLANEEVGKFQKYLESLDDDLFIDVCEYLGKSELNKIQECLELDLISLIFTSMGRTTLFFTLFNSFSYILIY